jgi:hypothetical protein
VGAALPAAYENIITPRGIEYANARPFHSAIGVSFEGHQ